MIKPQHETILVLDFGGQYKELIARSVRELSVHSQIRRGDILADEVKALNPTGIILTGGPDSVYAENAPQCDPAIFELGIPILGICYGMQLMCYTLKGNVAPCAMGEYGCVEVTPILEESAILSLPTPFMALMSHRDACKVVPEGFSVTAKTDTCIAVFEHQKRKLFGVQFHPESKHTQGGSEIIKNFLFGVCGAKGTYKLNETLDAAVKEVRQKVATESVLLGLSGGVDSSVCAALLSKAVPGQLTCVFVDHGFMRYGEGDEIENIFSKHDLKLIRVNAQKRFLDKLKGIVDPEQKRKIIGEEFIRVFEEEASKLDIPYLAQGTIYPDIVESGGSHGATIKSHHNVGGLPELLDFKGIVEPLSGLFKDEVRKLGKKLGLPTYLVNRQPFPGPGLAIRIMGEVTQEKLEVLQKADLIVREVLDAVAVKSKLGQYFVVLTDTKTVGVKGDSRTYDYCLAVRAVTTDDFMTCEYARLSHSILHKISSRLTSELPTVSRVVYDITCKPPATVEWE